MNDLVESAFVMAARLLEAGRASLLLREQNQDVLTPVAAIGLNPTILGGLRIRVGEGIAGSVAQKGVPLLGQAPDGTFLSVPVRTSSRVAGVLNLTEPESGTRYGERQLEIAKAVADHIGRLIEQSEQTGAPSESPAGTSFSQAIERELARARRANLPFAVALAVVPEAAGQPELAQALQTALRGVVRSYDSVVQSGAGRLGIVLAAPSSPLPDVVERLSDALDRAAEREGVLIAARIAMACFPLDATNLEQMLDRLEEQARGEL
ncbi:MAG: GAF domain-containing protein [Chloroflexota bacterium]